MSSSSSDDENFHPSLHTIPVEVFLHICTFLDGKEIVENLKLVCQNFYEILSDDGVWRTWLKHRWPALPTANPLYKDDIIPSQTICLQIDRGLQLWSKEASQIKKCVDGSDHFSTVDTVKLLKNGVGVSGSRDRSMAVWRTTGGLSLVEHKANAHDGWIWRLASCDDTNSLYSCSWDSSVKLWSINEALTLVSTFKCKAAALSVVCRPGLVAAGLFLPRVLMFDPRSGDSVGTFCGHARSIMALCIVRDFIVSASEDQTISVWDITAGRHLKSGIRVGEEGHPMTLSFSEGNLLLVGDTMSKLHVYDTSNDSFHHVETFDMGHKQYGTITSMWHNPGFVVTGSKDATVRIHSTTRPPHLINQLASSHGGVTAVDFMDPVMLIGCVDSAVELWTPLET